MIVGRKKEIELLRKVYGSGQAELVAIYGMERVGKTYLVDNVFEGKMIFRHAGMSPIESSSMSGRSSMKKQLKHFYNSLVQQGMKKSKQPADWLEAFYLLESFIESKDDGGRMVVFLDELPWLDTPRSGFISAFEGFWNSWACCRKNLMLIVCGSATTWMVNKLINNYGGLYGRVTCEIRLSTFNLGECEEFFKSKK